MLTRSIALLFIPVLMFAPLMAPCGSAATANFAIAGIVATALALFALVNDRARVGVALVGAWVAFSPFILRFSLVEEIVAVGWGVSTFVLMAGPFSARPRVHVVASSFPAKRQSESHPEHRFPAAA